MNTGVILKDIRIENNCICYEFSAYGSIKKMFNTNLLWIDYGTNIENIPKSILVIPFVSVMLPVIWVMNGTLWINEIDRTFYESSFLLRRAYSDLYPKYPLKGKIVPSYIIENTVENKEDGFMLFSGGLDAHTSYIRHLERIKFLVNIQGWYKNIDEVNIVANADFKLLKQFAFNERKMPVMIRSNFANIVNVMYYQKYAKKIGDSLWHGFQHSMAFISFTIPLVYLNNGGTVIIASSFTVGDQRVCASYPTTDNEFKFACQGKTLHDGFELSRQDKIAVLVKHQRKISKPYPIQVCSFNDHNCCTCEKCFRTILGLVAEGANLEDFGFYINRPLLDFYKDFFYNNLALFGVENESLTHWPHIKKRMEENYNNLDVSYQNFIDWFLTYNFKKERRKAIRKYYRKNFFSILKRKLKKIKVYRVR